MGVDVTFRGCGYGLRSSGGPTVAGEASKVRFRRDVHKPCLARASVTSLARVESCGDSVKLRLPEEDR